MLPSSTSSCQWILRSKISKDLISEEKVEIVCPSKIHNTNNCNIQYRLDILPGSWSDPSNVNPQNRIGVTNVLLDVTNKLDSECDQKSELYVTNRLDSKCDQKSETHFYGCLLTLKLEKKKSNQWPPDDPN